MPSDTAFARAADVLQVASSAFRSALVGALDELSAFTMSQRAPRERRVDREAIRLGQFATGRIDAARFAELTGATETLDSIRIGRLQQACDVLAEFIARGDDLYRVTVAPGADLRDAVRAALANRGRVFNAAQAFDVLRSGATLKGPVGEALEFRDWSKVQRTLAPPIIVDVSGADLQVEGLGEYLDGMQKIVLLVREPAAPAPLARLLSPATFVMQTNRLEDLRLLAAFPGPGIAAVMPDECARFVNDPSRGTQLGQRLVADFVPGPLTHAIAGGSLRQQVQDLAWLTELVRVAALSQSAAPATADTPEAAPADRLAAWLLRQADLDQA